MHDYKLKCVVVQKAGVTVVWCRNKQKIVSSLLQASETLNSENCTSFWHQKDSLFPCLTFNLYLSLTVYAMPFLNSQSKCCKMTSLSNGSHIRSGKGFYTGCTFSIQPSTSPSTRNRHKCTLAWDLGFPYGDQTSVTCIIGGTAHTIQTRSPVLF